MSETQSPPNAADFLTRSTKLASKWLKAASGKPAAIIAIAGLTIYIRAITEIAKVSGDSIETVDKHFHGLLEMATRAIQ
jgi:hypothetical protein